MEEKISKVVLGIRYKRTFRIPEISGSIIDYVINDSSSPFKGDFFQTTDALIDNFENKGRVLQSKKGSSIVIDIDNFILNFKIGDFKSDLGRIKSKIIPFIKKIFNKFEIKDISRVGFVFEFTDKDKDIPDRIIKNITNNNCSNIDKFVLRFSEKDTYAPSFLKKNLLDYVNKIFIMTQTEKGFNVKFDYQFYYLPVISFIDDINFNDFIDLTLEKFKALNWYKQDEN